MRRAGRALSAVLVVAGLQLAGPAADAADRRPCVSKAEFNATRYAETRAVLEARWEVAGLGRHVQLPVIGSATEYPRCGELHSGRHYAVQYVPEDGRLYGYTLVAWREPQPEPVELPAPDPTPCPECSVVHPRAFALAAADGNAL